MELPLGIFDLIIEYMPLPRLWQWSLFRLRNRCKVSPQAAINDISILMDEILIDSNIFQGKNQSLLLVRINRTPSVSTSYSFILTFMLIWFL